MRMILRTFSAKSSCIALKNERSVSFYKLYLFTDRVNTDLSPDRLDKLNGFFKDLKVSLKNMRWKWHMIKQSACTSVQIGINHLSK